MPLHISQASPVMWESWEVASSEASVINKVMSLRFTALTDRKTLYFSMPFSTLPGLRIPAGVGLAGTVARQSEMINIPDAYADDRFNQDIDKKI